MVKQKKPGHQHGFTTIELIVSIVILGIVGLSTFSFLGNTMRTYVRVKEHKVLYDEGRLAMKYMVNDVRNCIRDSIIVNPSGHQISFNRKTPSIQNWTYTQSGNTLIRSSGGQYVLVGNVSEFNVAYDSGAQMVNLELVLTLAERGTIRFNTRVYPRNAS